MIYLKQAILDYLKDGNERTLVELDSHLEKMGFDIRGTSWIGDGDSKNLFFWCNMSETYQEALLNLKSSKQIDLIVIDSSVYLADSLTISLPSGKSMNLPVGEYDRTYQTYHWLPVLIQISK